MTDDDDIDHNGLTAKQAEMLARPQTCADDIAWSRVVSERSRTHRWLSLERTAIDCPYCERRMYAGRQCRNCGYKAFASGLAI